MTHGKFSAATVRQTCKTKEWMLVGWGWEDSSAHVVHDGLGQIVAKIIINSLSGYMFNVFFTITGEILENKLTSECFLCLPSIDHGFRHDIVKVAVDPQIIVL